MAKVCKDKIPVNMSNNGNKFFFKAELALQTMVLNSNFFTTCQFSPLIIKLSYFLYLNNWLLLIML